MADDFKAARPLEYYRKFLEKDVRPDGRELGEFRPTILNIGCISTAEGSALVKLGNTTVMCGIKAELATPKTEEPSNGYLVPNVELSPLCSPMFRPGPPGEQAQVLSHFVNEVLDRSGCIRKEDLCIQTEKLVWVLYCDILCLDYDGNVADACILSLLAALKSTRLPAVKYNEETEKPETDSAKLEPLHILSNPVSSTFAIFDDRLMFVDPTVKEESLTTGTVTIVTNDNDLCIVQKPGGSPLTADQINTCFERAFSRSKEVLRLIDETLHSIER
ncbi:hypothetical protein ACJMK2_032650 [Sinanodonta woodiana]|uniref:Ribosomal RNA-processing protein 43 n=1 Tax=Sinanodonta woodiana TaxID=1069815 RepID=A0ABD3X3W8_SINWO